MSGGELWCGLCAGMLLEFAGAAVMLDSRYVFGGSLMLRFWWAPGSARGLYLMCLWCDAYAFGMAFAYYGGQGSASVVFGDSLVLCFWWQGFLLPAFVMSRYRMHMPGGAAFH